MIKQFCSFVSLLFIFQIADAQTKISLNQYIDSYKDIAMEEMRKHGIPASIKLAQGILESGFGNSDLAQIGKNHFGVKCHKWNGKTFNKDDDERDECFRAYDDPLQSWRDHSEFLTTRKRYEFLFNLKPDDYKGWAKGLQKAGYATNRNYPKLLIRIIEENELYKYDKQVLKKGIAKNNKGKSTVNIADPDDFSPVALNREVLMNNRIRYVIALRGDTPESIAKEFEMREWQIYKYNDLERTEALVPGQIVYLQPKRRRAEVKEYIVKPGETVLDISQKFGVKTKSIYRRNDLEKGSEPNPGDTLILR
ncbi:MAG: glucosaminidase domain-containing protein [Bacteroidota bacterium]